MMDAHDRNASFILPALCNSRPALGGIAPNQVIARSEFEVHREMYTE